MAERLQVRWDKPLDMREITPEQLLTEYFEDLSGLQGDKKQQLQRYGNE